MAEWDYGGAYKNYDMTGVIDLPMGSKVQVCDWLIEMPGFMKDADTLFIDCPWNVGNLNTFYTKADKPFPGVDFVQFTAKIFERIDQIAPEFLFMEIGKEFLAEYLMACKSRFKYVTFYNSTYYKNKSNKCYVIHATSIHKQRRYQELEDLDEEKVIAWLCENHSYECIGDLCMGTGLVGKYAYQNGKRFVGTELNAKRLALLVDFITQKESAKC